MSQPPGANAGPPDVIYVIRHGEKPADPPSAKKGEKPKPAPPFGVDFAGCEDVHGLLPLGWQRSGALTALFDPATGPLQAGLLPPRALLSPEHGDPAETVAHRTYQTIQGLAGRLGLLIGTSFEVGQESQLAASLLGVYAGVVLVCWDHQRIPALAQALPTAPGTAIPGRWPEDRYDVIWAFRRLPGPAAPCYAFSQVPQQLLPGDTDTVIAPLSALAGDPVTPRGAGNAAGTSPRAARGTRRIRSCRCSLSPAPTTRPSSNSRPPGP